MFKDALTELASLTVTGVTNNYALDAVPDRINRGQLPALLVLPIETDSNRSLRLFPQKGEGFETVGFANGVRTVTYSVTHLLLVAPEASGRGMRTHLPELVDLIDAYFSALSLAVTLNGRLLEPAQVRVDPGLFTHGDVVYYGCAFRHTWVVQV